MVALKGTNGVFFVSLAAIAGLSASAMAQPRVEYGVIGSISVAPMGGPWPNLVTNDLPTYGYLVPIDDVRVQLMNGSVGYVLSSSGIHKLWKWNEQVPGLPAGTTWLSGGGSRLGDAFMPMADGSVAVTGMPGGIRQWTLRYDGNLFSIVGHTYAAADANSAFGDAEGVMYGYGPVGGPFVPVIPNLTSFPQGNYPIEGMPGYSYGWSGGAIFGLARGGEGGWVLTPTRDSQTGHSGPAIIAPFDGATGRLGQIFKSRDYVPDVGGVIVLPSSGVFSPYCAIATGDITLRLYVSRVGAPQTTEIWRVSRDGRWRSIASFPCTLGGLPEGAVATGYTGGVGSEFLLNSRGQVCVGVNIAGPSIPAGATAMAMFDERGGRVVFRDGQGYPNIANGQPLTVSGMELSEDGCVAIFGYSGQQGYLVMYREDVGLVEVASNTRPVANGMLTTRTPTYLTPGFGRTFRYPANGRTNWFDSAGRFRFFAYSPNSCEVYTVRLLPPCLADFDGDGFVDSFDFDAFVACFEGGACPPGKTADFDGDGFVDSFDYDGFVAAFEGGCEG